MTVSEITSFQWSTGSWAEKAINLSKDGSSMIEQILRFGRGKFPHPHLVKNDEIELGEFCAIPKVVAARAGDREILLERGDAHVEYRFATGTVVQADRLGDERF